MRRFVRNVYVPFILNKTVQIIIGAVFLGLLATNIFFISTLEVQSKLEWYLNDNFVTSKAFDYRDEYFEDLGSIVMFYTFDVDFSSINIQKELKEF